MNLNSPLYPLILLVLCSWMSLNLRYRTHVLLDLITPGILLGEMKRTGFLKGEPDSLYHRNNPSISRYHIQNSFQLHITNVPDVYVITWVYSVHNPEDCNTNLWVHSPWATWKTVKKVEAVANLLLRGVGMMRTSSTITHWQRHNKNWPSGPVVVGRRPCEPLINPILLILGGASHLKRESHSSPIGLVF